MKNKKRPRKQEKKARKRRKHASPSKKTSEASLTSTAKSSAIFLQSMDLTVSLLPSTIGNVQKGIEQCLNSYLLKYSDGMEGVLLAFENVKVLSRGKILNDLPFIHYNVRLDGIVFRPCMGFQMVGMVTEIFPSHISLIVHNFFNASVSSKDMEEAGFSFDTSEQIWKSDEESIVPDSRLSFVCTDMFESQGVVSLLGDTPCLLADVS